MAYAIREIKTGLYATSRYVFSFKFGRTSKLSEALCFYCRAEATDFINRCCREQFDVIDLGEIVGLCREIGGRLHVPHPDDLILIRCDELAEFINVREKRLAQGKDPDVFQWVPYVDDKSDQKQKEESMDDIYHEAVRHVRATSYVSLAAIQRTFVIGYNRAARLIEDMERNGVVSKPDDTGKREILNA